MFGVPLDAPAPLLIDRNVPVAIGALTTIALPSLGLVSGLVAEVAHLTGWPVLLLSLTAWAINHYSVRRRNRQTEAHRAHMEANPELYNGSGSPYLVPGPRG